MRNTWRTAAAALLLGLSGPARADAEPHTPPALGASATDARPAAPSSESRSLGPAPSDAAAPDARGEGEPSSIGPTLRTVFSLAAVLGIIGVCAYGARRLSLGQGGLLPALGPAGRAPSGVLSILGRYPVGRGQTLVLLRIESRVLLLCQNHGGRVGGAGGMTTLCELDDPDEVASIIRKAADEEGESLAKRFRSALGRADEAFAPPPDLPQSVADYPSPVRVQSRTPEGDTVELLAVAPRPRREPEPAAVAEPEPAQAPEDPAAALRKRLESLRGRAASTGGLS